MIRVSFQAMAAEELREVHAWYAERDIGVALRLNDAINDAIERIQEGPGAHPIECEHYRWVRVRGFPYRLIFEELDEHRVLIVAVAHTSRDPRYWQDRI